VILYMNSLLLHATLGVTLGVIIGVLLPQYKVGRIANINRILNRCDRNNKRLRKRITAAL